MREKNKIISKGNIYIPKELSQYSLVWLRVDRVKQPLEVPFSGAHEVISFNHELKAAQIKVNGLSQIVSIQKLEPCKLPLVAKKSHQLKINAKESPIKSNVATKLTFQERHCLFNKPYNGARLKCFNKNPYQMFSVRLCRLKSTSKRRTILLNVHKHTH